MNINFPGTYTSYLSGNAKVEAVGIEFWYGAKVKRAREEGVKPKKQKCEIKIPEFVYIGDKITKDGIKPDESKIEAILNLPTPQNKKDVERLLGMVTYLSKFIPLLTPFHVY